MGLLYDDLFDRRLYIREKQPSPHDDIPSAYEMLEKMNKLWQGIDADEAIRMADTLANIGNINAYSAEEVGAALSKFSEKVDDDKFKKSEVEYKVL